jgi:DNA-binding NarL/FixJ family response regulator
MSRTRLLIADHLIARETLVHLLRKPLHHKEEHQTTPRQTEILQLLAEGRTMKQIASALDISQGTVAFHKYQMMRKLGITTNAGLYTYAMKNGFAGCWSRYTARQLSAGVAA